MVLNYFTSPVIGGRARVGGSYTIANFYFFFGSRNDFGLTITRIITRLCFFLCPVLRCNAFWERNGVMESVLFSKSSPKLVGFLLAAFVKKSSKSLHPLRSQNANRSYCYWVRIVLLINHYANHYAKYLFRLANRYNHYWVSFSDPPREISIPAREISLGINIQFLFCLSTVP